MANGIRDEGRGSPDFDRMNHKELADWANIHFPRYMLYNYASASEEDLREACKTGNYVLASPKDVPDDVDI